MFEIIRDLSDIIQDIIRDVGYPGITLIMFLEYVFPPIPSELVLPFSGFLVGRGELGFWGVWVASIIGSFIGSILLYYIGLWAGEHVVRGFLRRYGRWIMLSEKDYDYTLKFFDKYGEVIVFTGRLIPIVRSLVSVPAGADRMPMRKFLPYTFLGSATWNGILIFAGMKLGDNWEKVIDFVERYQKITIVVIAIGVVAFVAYRLNNRTRTEDPATPTLDSANDTAE